MCATRHSANAVTTSGPDKQASWLFDLQDHQLIQLVNSFVAARNMSMSLAQPEEGLHPRGIIKLTTDPGMRIARAVIILLESLEARGPQERLQALRRLHDEVLYSALSSLQKNTARVLIQIMKDLVRAAPHVHIQLPLAHDFYQAVRGTPHVIRSLLRRYHLLEMPEAWNQQAFDHHVHDANTKGRKSPTHLVMDAWLKGLRFITVVYYNTVDPEAASELLRAARIMGITVRIGIEFRATFHDKLIEFTWSPLNVHSSRAFIKLLQRPDIAAILKEYATVNQWMRQHVLRLLQAWNQKHAATLARKLEVPPPPPLDADAFLAFVGSASLRPCIWPNTSSSNGSLFWNRLWKSSATIPGGTARMKKPPACAPVWKPWKASCPTACARNGWDRRPTRISCSPWRPTRICPLCCCAIPKSFCSPWCPCTPAR